MQDRNKINSGLNQLKQIFDIVEPYNPNDNLGYRSLKNIGVWLIAYALTEKSQQLEVVQDLSAKANKSHEVAAIKNMIDFLSTADNLTSIINDYEKANGTFEIFIRDASRLGGFKAKAKEVGLSTLVDKHFKVDPSKGADLVFDMNNTLKFSWQATDHNAATLEKGKNIFNNETIDYLTANSDDHNVTYDLIALNDNLFHVVRLGALQNDGKNPPKETYVYLIEAADAKSDPTLLQKNYFDIVKLFKPYRYQENYADLKRASKKLNQNSLKITELHDTDGSSNVKEFNILVHFPELAGPLKTAEHRLGVYASFLGKKIGSFYAGNLAYSGQRELEYDAEGGTIKNREELCVYKSCMMRETPSKIIMIEYTTKGPYIMVYEAENAADYYPFKIIDPRRNLEKSFDKSKTYDPSSTQDQNLKTSVTEQPNNILSDATQPLFSHKRSDSRSKTGSNNPNEENRRRCTYL